MKEWIKHERVFCMGFPGFIWVIAWLYIELWHKLCGFGWPGFEKISQTLCKMVLQVFEGKKHQLRWSYWTWEEYSISLSFSLSVGSVQIMGQLWCYVAYGFMRTKMYTVKLLSNNWSSYSALWSLLIRIQGTIAYLILAS